MIQIAADHNISYMTILKVEILYGQANIRGKKKKDFKNTNGMLLKNTNNFTTFKITAKISIFFYLTIFIVAYYFLNGF